MNLTLSLIDFASLSPLLILLFGALLLLLIESFAEKTAAWISAPIAAITIAAAGIATYYAPASTNPLLTNWLKFDEMYRFFTMLFLVIGLGTTFLAASFFRRFEASRGEYYFLLLSALMGLILIAASADFLTLFIGLETLSIALYILTAYMRSWDFSKEAALKYFLLGALAAALILYGVALIYGAVGTTRLDGLAQAYQNINNVQKHLLFFAGIALVTVGLAFKAAIVPFHIWAPDVYEGAPTPVTAFMAVGTKAGAFAGFSRVFFGALPNFDVMWNQGIAWLAIPTMIYANFVALKQTQLKRFFAYSGISHAGFLLIPFAAGGPDAFGALAFYLVVYTAATLGAFAIIAFLDDKKEGVMMSDLKGLFFRSPWLAGALSLCLLTLAGIPPTAGFLAKFYVLAIVFEAGYTALVVVALLSTILAAYYYLRIIAVMFSEAPATAVAPQKTLTAFVIGACAIAAIIALSIYPDQIFLNL
jgi:NADH-quinone oxidoreductase subunit N